MRNRGEPLPPDWVAGQWKTDSAAQSEASRWPDQAALQGTKDVNTLNLLRHSGRLAVVLMWFIAVAYVVSMGVWLFHFLTPYEWEWLQPEQLSKIQTVIFSGSLGAVVTVFVQKHLS